MVRVSSRASGAVDAYSTAQRRVQEVEEEAALADGGADHLTPAAAGAASAAIAKPLSSRGGLPVRLEEWVQVSDARRFFLSDDLALLEKAGPRPSARRVGRNDVWWDHEKERRARELAVATRRFMAPKEARRAPFTISTVTGKTVEFIAPPSVNQQGRVDAVDVDEDALVRDDTGRTALRTSLVQEARSTPQFESQYPYRSYVRAMLTAGCQVEMRSREEVLSHAGKTRAGESPGIFLHTNSCHPPSRCLWTGHDTYWVHWADLVIVDDDDCSIDMLTDKIEVVARLSQGDQQFGSQRAPSRYDVMDRLLHRRRCLVARVADFVLSLLELEHVQLPVDLAVLIAEAATDGTRLKYLHGVTLVEEPNTGLALERIEPDYSDPWRSPPSQDPDAPRPRRSWKDLFACFRRPTRTDDSI